MRSLSDVVVLIKSESTSARMSNRATLFRFFRVKGTSARKSNRARLFGKRVEFTFYRTERLSLYPYREKKMRKRKIKVSNCYMYNISANCFATFLQFL